MRKLFFRFSVPRQQPLEALRVYGELRGLQRRVARRLGVSASHVSRVIAGERRSARVEAAVAEELRALRRQAP